jgi:FixJ family two-component response regulator
MITGFMDPQAERRGQDIGIKEYLYKPFVNTEFIEAVQRQLGE